MIDLSICTVSWNVKKLLKECIESVWSNTKNILFEMTVVDNNSSDDSVQMVQKEFPQVKLIRNNTNAGFTKASNQAIKISIGRYIILLNSDTKVVNNALGVMVKFMDSHPDCGALGCKLLFPDGSLQRSCKTFPTLWSLFLNTIFLDQLFPKSKFFGKHFMTWWDHNDVREVDQPMGSALMIRKDVLDAVGLLDENILFWYDEVDLCYRIKKAGWKIYFTPDAQIIHHLSQGFKQWKSLKQVIKGAIVWRKSRNYFFGKHHGKLSVMFLWFLDILQAAYIFGFLYLVVCFVIFAINKIF